MRVCVRCTRCCSIFRARKFHPSVQMLWIFILISRIKYLVGCTAGWKVGCHWQRSWEYFASVRARARKGFTRTCSLNPSWVFSDIKADICRFDYTLYYVYPCLPLVGWEWVQLFQHYWQTIAMPVGYLSPNETLLLNVSERIHVRDNCVLLVVFPFCRKYIIYLSVHTLYISWY